MSSINPGPIGPATTARRGTMSAADKVKVDTISGTNTGDVTVASPAGWLSRVGQALTFALVSAGAGVSGVIDFGAQVIAGAKTFTSSIIASAGVQLASLWNTNGTGAGDVGVKVGVSTADASVNAAAKFLSVRTGIGGTEVEQAFVDKNGLVVSGSGGSRRAAVRTIGGSTYFYGEDATNGYLQWNTSVWNFSSLGTSSLNTMTGGWTTNAAVGVNGFGLLTAGSRISLNTTDALTYFAAVAAGIINTPAEVEITTAAKGVILKSPDGTRYRLTVANGGTLSIAAA